MSEIMVERVARAICFSRQSCEYCRTHCLATLSSLQKSDKWVKARAAIAAMRKPTKEMLDAAYRTGMIGDCGGVERDVFSEEYQAAIDAALSENP